MRRAVLLTALLLILSGGLVFGAKRFVYGMPLVPDPSARVWRIDWTIPIESDPGEHVEVELLLPTPNERQAILDEGSTDAGLRIERNEKDGARIARWAGEVGPDAALHYFLRVHLPSPGEASAESATAPWRRATSEPTPAPRRKRRNKVDPVFTRFLEEQEIDRTDEPDAIISQLFAFVANEIEAVEEDNGDPREVLASREGTIDSRHGLLRTLLEVAGIPATVRHGIRLPRTGSTHAETFVEIPSAETLERVSVVAERPGNFPRDFLVLSGQDRAPAQAYGAQLGRVSIDVLRESLPANEMASYVAKRSAILRSTTLYRLPVATREVLASLLVIPLAVLIAAAFRNLIGIHTFGTFMPVLLALSIRDLGLSLGFLLIAICLGVGVLGRLALDRLRLLFVPRVCLLLCLVILSVMVLAQVGHALGEQDLGKGLLFPIVILAMLIERISVTTLEEGWRASAVLLLGSLALTAASYPVFRSALLAHLFFGFPELVLCVMGGLVLIGGYTGYRVSELLRFRSFWDEPEASDPSGTP